MANFNKIWKNFLTEGTFQQKSADNDELYELETPENLKNDDQLLREVTEEELHHIYRAIEEMEASDLAFNELFDGKKRVVVDFPALNTTTELGRFINLWQEMGKTLWLLVTLISQFMDSEDLTINISTNFQMIFQTVN